MQTETTRFSYEFFPPRKAEQQRRFWRTVGCLETLKPEFFSVTYGALGSAGEASVDIVKELIGESQTPVAAHLTCIGMSKTELQNHIQRLATMGVKHIVALRGDCIEGQLDHQRDGLRFAEDLVKLIRQEGDFDISIAAYPETHPEAESAAADLDNLKRKLEAGASRALTQFFYDTEKFLRFRDTAVAAGVEKPIVPGILPIHDIDKVVAFGSRCGTVVPAKMAELFKKHAKDPLASQQYAIQHCVDMCEKLRSEGVHDLHFYTLNQSNLAHKVTRILRGEVESPPTVVAA